MFAVSLNWLCEILKTKISLDDMMSAFNIQGFEVKSIDQISDDYLITIEVKANRSDMLSHYGVAREIASFMNIKFENFKSKLELESVDVSKKVEVHVNENVCDYFCIIRIDGVDNSVRTPDYIKKRLEFFGINSINAVVDISNYIAIEMGQPTHAYDFNKIHGNCLHVCENKKDQKFTTLAGTSVDLKQGDILVCDDQKPLCVAGIIGSSNSEVDEQSKSIVIESAVFSKVPVRVASRRLKISSLASFRFERGVDPLNSFNINKIFAERILDICGGRITYHFEHSSKVVKEKNIDLRINRVNSILGTNLNTDTISNCLEKYCFKCEKKVDNVLSVKIPSFRLDIEREVDLIEEVARSIGYDNIAPSNMNVMANYRPNHVYERFDVIRNTLNGFGFNEVINYAFIPGEVCKIMNLKSEDCIFLQNPLSNLYDLMRTNLLYSLLYSLSYNYSIGNCNLSLYEIGRAYKRVDSSETLSSEENLASFVISGNRIDSGFGVGKNIKFDFYDMTSYLRGILSSFNMEYDFEKLDCDYLENSYSIMSKKGCIGFVGKVVKNKFLKLLPNLKLIKDNIFYCEINIDKIEEKNKLQKFESKFPSVVRMYNLICSKNISVKKIEDAISECGKEVYSIKVKDVYKNGIDSAHQAILFEICFWLSERTLKIEEIENLESKILSKLESLYKIKIK